MLPTALQKMARNKSEERFLVDQAAHARTAMTQTLAEMKQTLAKLTDVRTCARQHPWIATGSVLAVGFVAGAVLPRSRSASGDGHKVKTDAKAPPESTAHEPAQAKTGFFMATLGKALTTAVTTLLQSLVAAAVVAKEIDQVKEDRPTPGDRTPCTATSGGSSVGTPESVLP
jgi:hypothetical protein